MRDDVEGLEKGDIESVFGRFELSNPSLLLTERFPSASSISVQSSDASILEPSASGSVGCPFFDPKTRVANSVAILYTGGLRRLQSATTQEFLSGRRIMLDATPGTPPFMETVRAPPYMGLIFEPHPNAHFDGSPVVSGGRSYQSV